MKAQKTATKVLSTIRTELDACRNPEEPFPAAKFWTIGELVEPAALFWVAEYGAPRAPSSATLVGYAERLSRMVTAAQLLHVCTTAGETTAAEVASGQFRQMVLVAVTPDMGHWLP